MHTLSAYRLKIYLEEVSLLRFENHKYSQFLQQSKAAAGWETSTHTDSQARREDSTALAHTSGQSVDNSGLQYLGGGIKLDLFLWKGFICILIKILIKNQ